MTAPTDHLHAVSRDYPGAWAQYDVFLRSRAELGGWPDWCYCPLAAAYAIASEGGNLSLDRATDVARIAALAAWRPTQGIYRFDPTLLKHLLDTPITGDLPSEHLYRLPEWCVYVELPVSDMRGFFAHLEYDANDGRSELRILIDTTLGRLLPVPIHLGGTLERGVSEAFAEAGANGLVYLPPEMHGHVTRLIAPMISVLLYLCAPDADMRPTRGRGPVKPKLVRGKQGPRMPAAKSLEVWETGFNLGAQLRDAEASEGASGRSVRGHVRRAHWHSYWTGSGESKALTIKWLSPILVAAGPDRPTVSNAGSDG